MLMVIQSILVGLSSQDQIEITFQNRTVREIKSGVYFHSRKNVSIMKVLSMSFDKFLLAVESRDLSQADNIIIRVPSFPKMSDG
jgi:hypothetical protein